jgi:hypothetical protein
MSIVRTMKCTQCGVPHTVISKDRYDHPLGHVCNDCVGAQLLRATVGEGEYADQWMALLYPYSYAQEKVMVAYGQARMNEIRKLTEKQT